MQLIKLTDVVIPPNRQRRAFDEADLHKLSDSIQRLGLLHAPVLRQEGDSEVLVVGERRYRVLKDLIDLGILFSYNGQLVPPGMMPFTRFEALSSLAAMEAELEENTHRADLTWQERAAAVAKLYELRQAQAKEVGLPAPTIADLSIEVRGSSEGILQENTRRELILAKHLDNPAVKGATSIKEAFKILRREESTKKSEELGRSVGTTYSSAAHQLLHADSLEWMRKCEAGRYDVILTDPPYGMGADEFGDSGGMAAGAHSYHDDEATALRCYEVLAEESYRITKPQAHLYAFCDVDWFVRLRALFTQYDWQVFRTPLIWHKPTGMRAPWPEHGPQRKYEILLYAIKGKRPVLKLAPDVISCASDENLGHGAQKPVALFEELLRRSCRPGDSVLDPFCGTGTIFAAANTLQCYATGIELDVGNYGIATKRIQELK